jgi:copper homeostasis protein
VAALPLIEVCLDSADSAVAAEAGGAHRVELCDNLIEGGTTPSAGMIAATRKAIDIGLMVMIRPRGGDFCYSPREVEAMIEDIATARRLGAQGVVFGVLSPDGTVDAALSRRLLEASHGLEVTFHRAFDVTLDPYTALETLIELGFSRVLTSGQEPSVLEGIDLLAELVHLAGDRIVVMPGCGITPRNIHKVHTQCGARELHIVGNQATASAMQYRNPRVFMGTELRSSEVSRSQTSAEQIREMVGLTRS